MGGGLDFEFLSCSKWSYFLCVIKGKQVLRIMLYMKHFPIYGCLLVSLV